VENPEVAQIFEEVADLLELQGASEFRVRAYRNAARTIRDITEPLGKTVIECPKRLTELPGIGKDLAGKITTILKTGDLPLRQELCKQVPSGLRELLNLPGCGPKRVQLLHSKLHVNSPADLRKVIEQKKLRTIKGFGPKTEENLLKGLGQLDGAEKRMLLADAKVFADSILTYMNKAPGVSHLDMAGSFRRRKETVGDLDLLAVCRDPRKVMDYLANYNGVAEVLARGETKLTVRLKCGLQLDLRSVPEKSYGAALQYFTGSKPHNIAIRRLGQERGLKINEYGVFRGKRQIGGKNEAEVYAAVDLPWIPPELREARGEIEAARQGQLPKLIELSDVRGDLHMHTTATDGRASIAEMIAAAHKRHYQYIAITDHSKRVTMAKGLDAKRLREHWQAIEKIAEAYPEISVLKGVEVDILEDGPLDLSNAVLKEADWVVASIHYGQNQSRERITRRIIGAIRNPHVHAIGHPTGRLIGKRPPYAVDLDEILKAAADYGCAMELNCQTSRLDLDDAALATAKKRGVEIVLGSDAHAVEELRFMEFGIYQARRGGLEAADVLNSRPLRELTRSLR
jgi:DNA polymerase (family 10)